jgi:hypothetical protein
MRTREGEEVSTLAPVIEQEGAEDEASEPSLAPDDEASEAGPAPETPDE